MNNVTMTGGEVRKLTGVSRSQLRYWEQRGIVNPSMVVHASRTWRLYPAEQTVRVAALKRLLDEGYSLKGAVRRLAGNTVTAAAELAPALEVA